eukprot:scaffold32324_cov71-Phaeocystis_antarctica.AAC.5
MIVASRALVAPSAPLSTRGWRGVLVVAPRVDIVRCHCRPCRGSRDVRRLGGVSHRPDGGCAGGVDRGEPTSGPAAPIAAQRGSSRAAACHDEAVAPHLYCLMAAAATVLRRRLQGRPPPEGLHHKRLCGRGPAQPARRRRPRVERAVLAAAEDARRVRVGGAARGGAEVALEHAQPAAAR